VPTEVRSTDSAGPISTIADPILLRPRRPRLLLHVGGELCLELRVQLGADGLGSRDHRRGVEELNPTTHYLGYFARYVSSLPENTYLVGLVQHGVHTPLDIAQVLQEHGPAAGPPQRVDGGGVLAEGLVSDLNRAGYLGEFEYRY
jgi:hypothetical protein